MLKYLPLLLALPLAALDAQLSLRDALRLADSSAYNNRIAGADARAQHAQALAPLQGILPNLRVEAGALATTDPINAFGTKLRQRRITAADFNPTTLNFPDAARTRMAGLVWEQPLFNADAWTGRRAAAAAADATDAMQDWTRTGTRVDVITAYYGSTLALEVRSTLDAARRAADAHVARARALADTGLVTRSDALLAEVKAGEIHAEFLEAESDVAHAQRGLAVVLGVSQLPNALPTTLPDAARIRSIATRDAAPPVDATATPSADRRDEGQGSAAVDTRADVRAAAAARRAAAADAWRAKALYLPRVNGFARYDWNDRNALFANERAWTVGVMATWTPFAGASEIGEVRGANARAAAADARAEAAAAQAALDLARSRDRVAVALAQLEIAERAVTQAAEAHRIVARKYDGGLATISDLLEAAALETQSRLGEAAARYRLILATAERHVAIGADLSAMVALDNAPTDR
jgi:outer membrane protein TolC